MRRSFLRGVRRSNVPETAAEYLIVAEFSWESFLPLLSLVSLMCHSRLLRDPSSLLGAEIKSSGTVWRIMNQNNFWFKRGSWEGSHITGGFETYPVSFTRSVQQVNRRKTTCITSRATSKKSSSLQVFKSGFMPGLMLANISANHRYVPIRACQTYHIGIPTIHGTVTGLWPDFYISRGWRSYRWGGCQASESSLKTVFFSIWRRDNTGYF